MLNSFLSLSKMKRIGLILCFFITAALGNCSNIFVDLESAETRDDSIFTIHQFFVAFVLDWEIAKEVVIGDVWGTIEVLWHDKEDRFVIPFFCYWQFWLSKAQYILLELENLINLIVFWILWFFLIVIFAIVPVEVVEVLSSVELFLLSIPLSFLSDKLLG